jgi:hypothetical protein
MYVLVNVTYAKLNLTSAITTLKFVKTKLRFAVMNITFVSTALIFVTTHLNFVFKNIYSGTLKVRFARSSVALLWRDQYQ